MANFKNITLTIKTREIQPTAIQVVIKSTHYGLVIADYGRTGNNELDNSLDLGRQQAWGEFNINNELSDLTSGMLISFWLSIAAIEFGKEIKVIRISH